MRRALLCSTCLLSLTLPTLAHASPFGVAALRGEPAAGDAASTDAAAADAPAPTTEAPAMDADPTAVPEEEPVAEGPAEDGGPDVTDAGDPTAPPPEAAGADVAASEEAAKKGSGEMNRHAIGVRSGLTVVPTWILSGFLASHTNSLCRGDVGNFAEDRGLTKVQGCNFYVGGEYIFRKSPVFDIAVSAGWQKMKTPDGIWLDADECDSNGDNCNLSAADYTEVDLSFVFVEADFIGRYPIVKNDTIEIGIGGGGGIGVGIITGEGILQTPLGPLSESQDPQGVGTCNSIADFSDMRKCSPHYRADPDIEPNKPPAEARAEWSDPAAWDRFGGADAFVTCSKDECNERDMRLSGGRIKNEDVPPVIPVVNLILSTRFIVKDVWSLDIRGGFQTGFYFGAAMAYHFSGKAKDAN